MKRFASGFLSLVARVSATPELEASKTISVPFDMGADFGLFFGTPG
jgi:hypothetical protein